MNNYQALTAHLTDIHNLNMAYWMLQWDQNTHMPPDGGKARAAQLATLQRIRHERLTDDRTANLLEAAEQEVDTSDFHSVQTGMIRVAKADYMYASQLPADFVAEYARTTGEAFEVWRLAKETDQFELFAPALQRILDLKLEEASIRGHNGHPYDVCLGRWERDLTTAQVETIFNEQRDTLVELVQAVNANQDKVDDRMLHQHFPIDKQRELAIFVSEAFGLDYERSATFDVSPHPFCLQIATGDIRLTTRFYDDFFNAAFFGTLHETGHGLHGQGFAPEIDGTFLSDMELVSQAVCESQSRTWENLVGRSRAFWEWLMPKALEIFPEQFGGFIADDLYRAVNRVRPQLIRVEADELTYNLHIMLRFDVEKALVEGAVKVNDVPDLWRERCKTYLGIEPEDDRTGVLQDVHWSMGGIGAFVGYALGNMLASQYYQQALNANPNIPETIARGDFAPLLNWLTENIYRHGRKYTADELTRQVSGEPMQASYYLDYLQQKFSDVYQL